EMEDRRGEHGAGVTVANAVDQVLEIADAAGGNDRHRHRIRHGAGESNVEASPGAVTIHGGEQDFPGAEHDHFACVVDGIEPGRVAAAVGKDLPAIGFWRV